jgi:hypothetical protein
MRPVSLYYLIQAWPAQQRRRGRHAMARRRYQPTRELPALARRVFAALTGSSQPA